MRYIGQGHEISVALPVERYGEAHGERFAQRFEQAYRQLYGRTIDGVEIEALSWTLTIAEKDPADPAPGQDRQAAVADCNVAAAIGRHQLFDPEAGQFVDAGVYLREDLPAGMAVEGPALITEEQTTTVVPPAWRACVDDRGAIILTRKETADE